MAELQSLGRETTPTIPQKRQLEDDHLPAIPSPLNPDAGNLVKAPRARREAKDSYKKRESKVGPTSGEVKGTPERKTSKTAISPSIVSPIRYLLPAPLPKDYAAPAPPIMSLHHAKGGTEFLGGSDHVHNRRGFRYSHCVADPGFPFSLFYRQSECEPFGPRINFEDSSSHTLFTSDGKQVTTNKGFRMARANVAVREGRWYWECKITSGIEGPNSVRSKDEDTHMEDGGEPLPAHSGGHVRIGWARREAALDGPVGFDAYSYGLRDVGGQKVHLSRPKDFFPAGESIREGDVIGLEINLPSLALHRKVVAGDFNPLVDVVDAIENTESEAAPIIRDRIPIRYRSHLYFEHFDYQPTKELEDLMNPSTAIGATSTASSTVPPSPTHPLIPMRTLPNSSIRIYKNGRFMGTPFTDLLAFLPPASKTFPGSVPRPGLDDGMLGYYPAVSVFRGGAAELNLGPNFWFPPSSYRKDESRRSKDPSKAWPARAVGERYTEQIVEDIVYDIIDEIDYWEQDKDEKGVVAPLLKDGAAIGLVAGSALAGEIKEIVQEDE
ncbi:MAG: hypothetical protein M1829_006265 [Trizodia sp. TS-e1964]|nr:MAG: hypothetical protein M1829_006265 [Trizodia sp. TS-e1964]